MTCAEYNLDGSSPADGGISYSASGGAGGFTFTWADTDNPGSSRDNLPVGMYIISIADMNGCTTIDTTELTAVYSFNARIEIYPSDLNGVFDEDELPDYPSGQDDTLCYLSVWDLMARSDITSPEITWSPGDLLDVPGDSVSPATTFTLRQPVTFRLELSNGICMDYDLINLYMFDTLGMHITTEQYRILDSIYNQVGDPLDLFSTGGFTAYQWFALDTLGNDMSEFLTDNEQNTQVIPTQPQMVGVFALNPNSCYERDTVWLIIRQPINVPYDVFTPNDDGWNDFWRIPYAEQYPNLEVYIFNRWGQQVFYSKPYGTDQFHTWDGTSQKNGKRLPIGSYYYIVKPNDGEQEPITGTVTIVR